MSFDDATIRFYRENAAEYVKGPQRSFARLHTFLVALPRPTNGSPEMAAEAACRLGRPVETLRFDQLDEHDHYDAVWVSACLLHVPKANLQGVLARIWQALKPAGRDANTESNAPVF